jgi:hypothetical protein
MRTTELSKAARMAEGRSIKRAAAASYLATDQEERRREAAPGRVAKGRGRALSS